MCECDEVLPAVEFRGWVVPRRCTYGADISVHLEFALLRALVSVFFLTCTHVRKGGGATATFDSCTCCVIKPHAVKAGNVGKIIDKIFGEVTCKAQRSDCYGC